MSHQLADPLTPIFILPLEILPLLLILLLILPLILLLNCVLTDTFGTVLKTTRNYTVLNMSVATQT